MLLFNGWRGFVAGELTLALPVAQVLTFPTQGQPILLKVTAEEVRINPQEPPSQSTTIQLALIPPGKFKKTKICKIKARD